MTVKRKGGDEQGRPQSNLNIQYKLNTLNMKSSSKVSMLSFSPNANKSNNGRVLQFEEEVLL